MNGMLRTVVNREVLKCYWVLVVLAKVVKKQTFRGIN